MGSSMSLSGSPLPPRKDRPTKRTHLSEMTRRVLVFLICFVCGASLLVLMIWRAERLTAFNLMDKVYFLVLVLIGSAVGVVLFTISDSYAWYEGKVYGGVLKIGGPVVVAALVVVGGSWLLIARIPFAVTVFIHGEEGVGDLVLKNSGHVYLDLDGDRREQPIGEKGEAYFVGIPANFHGREVPVWVELTDFECVEGDKEYRLDGTSLYITVRRKSGRLAGRVVDSGGNPIAGVKLQVTNLSTTTDTLGHFRLDIPGDKMADEFDLEAVLSGYKPEHVKVVPSSGEMTIMLSRVR